MPKQGVLLSVPKQPLPLRLTVGKDIICDAIEYQQEQLKTKTEVGDHAKLREALQKIVLLTVKAGKSISCDVACGIIASTAKCALKQPPRNCDVGTAEEQEERYIKLKREHSDKLARCPAVGQSFFPDSLYWAQMPYEEV